LLDRTNKIALHITAPKQDAEFLQAANAYFKGAQSAKCFAFAIQFSAIHFIHRLRQESASNSAPRLAANR